MSSHTNVSYLTGSDNIFEQSNFEAFSPKVMQELEALGTYFLKNGESDSNITAIGFWLRATNLRSIAAEYTQGDKRVGKGVAFHIAPGNVDTLFFYSIIVSLISGNPTILRLSSKQSDSSGFVVSLYQQAIKKLSLETLSANVAIVNYQPKSKENITQSLSLRSNLRVIWGSDETVSEISKLQQKKGGITVSFPHRYSCSVLSITRETLQKSVNAFLSDIKPFYQQACSSPKVIYWLNTEASIKEKFWQLVDEKLCQFLPQVPFSAIEQIERLSYLQSLALSEDGLISIEKGKIVTRFSCNSISRSSIDRHVGLYQFIEQDVSSIEKITTFEHCQTMAYFGIDVAEIMHVNQNSKHSLDFKRQIALGQSLQFSHHWDGVDLISTLSKVSDKTFFRS